MLLWPPCSQYLIRPTKLLIANLGVRLDLKQIALRCRNTEFNPCCVAAIIMRLRELLTMALLFASGRMIITGTKCAHNSALAIKKFAYIIERVLPYYSQFSLCSWFGRIDTVTMQTLTVKPMFLFGKLTLGSLYKAAGMLIVE